MFHIEFNNIHDYGNGILCDFGGVYMGSQCDSKSESYYEDYCYTYIHVYNNLIRNAKSYLNEGVFVYSDTSSGRNAFENNLMYGSGGTAINHHCVRLKQRLLKYFYIFSISRDVITYQRTTSFIGKEVPTILRNISLEVVKRVHLKILRPTLDHTTFS